MPKVHPKAGYETAVDPPATACQAPLQHGRRPYKHRREPRAAGRRSGAPPGNARPPLRSLRNPQEEDNMNTLISVDDLVALQASGGRPVLLDCGFELTDAAAGERAYAAGHLPGAVYAHLETELSGP